MNNGERAKIANDFSIAWAVKYGDLGKAMALTTDGFSLLTHT